MLKTLAFINGTAVDTPGDYANVDPSTDQLIGTVARGDSELVDRAVRAARDAQRTWVEFSPSRRATILERLSEVILVNRQELARIESQDTGKPLTQALADATVAARYFEYYGRAIESYYGLSLPSDPEFHIYTRREPLGVCGSILAWNYPMQLLGRSVAPAIAVGNAVVVKPADETPRSAVRIAELAVQAGLPDGVLNIVPGLGREAGAALAAHPGVDHIAFVGSSAVGSQVAAAAAKNVVPTSLELGGKSPHLVFPDADLDVVTRYVTLGILQNAGQTCSAGSRLLAHSAIVDELTDRLKASFQATSIGAGLEDRDLGPLVSSAQLMRVRGFVEGAKGTIVSGGRAPDGFLHGAYYEPTLITNVDPMSDIARQEVFGPVLVSMTFDTEDEAIHLANSTDYALMAAIWTRDISRVHRLASLVEAGQVYANSYGAGGGVEYPFGGFKKSGYGREKGFEALDAYTATKTVIVKL